MCFLEQPTGIGKSIVRASHVPSLHFVPSSLFFFSHLSSFSCVLSIEGAEISSTRILQGDHCLIQRCGRDRAVHRTLVGVGRCTCGQDGPGAGRSFQRGSLPI